MTIIEQQLKYIDNDNQIHKYDKQYESVETKKYTDENGDNVTKTVITKITTTKTVKYSAITI